MHSYLNTFTSMCFELDVKILLIPTPTNEPQININTIYIICKPPQ